MLPLILIAASLLPSQKAAMECADAGAAIASAETDPAHGPSGATAVLKVSTSDDHSKDSHDCNADYKLAVTPSAGGAPVEVNFLASDGDYGRSLSPRLAGFSQDGKRVLGILAEGGNDAVVRLPRQRRPGGDRRPQDAVRPRRTARLHRDTGSHWHYGERRNCPEIKFGEGLRVKPPLARRQRRQQGAALASRRVHSGPLWIERP
jgi:hypothetical protein